eukprot:scaffold400802_cov24-Attheya_sp.AAC.1
MKSSILSQPILQRADKTKRTYLRTDFSTKGMGYAVLQPSDDPESLAAMKRENEGGPCKFDLQRTGLRLLPTAFGFRLCKGFEIYLHSYFGECRA